MLGVTLLIIFSFQKYKKPAKTNRKRVRAWIDKQKIMAWPIQRQCMGFYRWIAIWPHRRRHYMCVFTV